MKILKRNFAILRIKTSSIGIIPKSKAAFLRSEKGRGMVKGDIIKLTKWLKRQNRKIGNESIFSNIGKIFQAKQD